MTDDALDRLRAADPAAGTEPDSQRIHAAVAAATGVPLAGETAEVLPIERRRRPARWLQVAAAVVGVAVVGTGGYLVGTNGPGTGATTADALPPISLNGASGDSGAGSTAENAPMAAGADRAAGSPAIYPGGFYGRTVFTGQGLSTAGGSAVAWGFDPSGVASAETAARVAAALGVAGDVRTEWGSWVVGPNDGSGPNVSLSGDGMASVSYYDPSRDPLLCGEGGGANGTSSGAAEVAPLPAPDTKDVTTLPAPADPTVCDQGTTPTGDAAVAKAREALAAIGVDTSSTQVQTDDSSAKAGDTGGAAYVYVTFSQVIDGQLTGVQWSVSLVGDGVQSLYGPLAPLVELGSYDVVSPAQAVERLGDPRFGASGGVIAYAEGAGIASDAAVAEPSQDPTVPPAPTAGAPIAWPVQQVTITSARLGLALTYLSNGGQVLVPAYELTDAQGTTWSVIAVVDELLDFSPVG